MESEWRLNRERFHAGGPQWWTGPVFHGALFEPGLVMELITPIPWLPDPITHVITFPYNGFFWTGFWGHLLMGTLFASTAGTFTTLTPPPFGFAVKPDHI